MLVIFKVCFFFKLCHVIFRVRIVQWKHLAKNVDFSVYESIYVPSYNKGEATRDVYDWVVNFNKLLSKHLLSHLPRSAREKKNKMLSNLLDA